MRIYTQKEREREREGNESAYFMHYISQAHKEYEEQNNQTPLKKKASRPLEPLYLLLSKQLGRKITEFMFWSNDNYEKALWLD